MAKNEEKPCPEIFTNEKLKFSAKLVEKNAILTNFLSGIFFRFFFQGFLLIFSADMHYLQGFPGSFRGLPERFVWSIRLLNA